MTTILIIIGVAVFLLVDSVALVKILAYRLSKNQNKE